MKKEFSVTFTLHSGKEIQTVVTSDSIENAHQFVEEEIERSGKILKVETTEKLHRSIILSSISFFDVRPYNLHPQKNK